MQVKSTLDLPYQTPFLTVFMGEGLYTLCTCVQGGLSASNCSGNQGSQGPMHLQCQQRAHCLSMFVCVITSKYQAGLAEK